MSFVGVGVSLTAERPFRRVGRRRVPKGVVSAVPFKPAFWTGSFDITSDDRSKIVEVMALADKLVFTSLSSPSPKSHFLPS
jgi:hypothetical protein